MDAGITIKPSDTTTESGWVCGQPALNEVPGQDRPP